MSHKLLHHPKRLALLLLVLLLLALSSARSAWATLAEHALRQTVPLTPPPTWTPVRPPATPTPLPTRPVPPRPPTSVPQDTPMPEGTAILQPSAVAPNTSVPGTDVPRTIVLNTSVPSTPAPSTRTPGTPVLGATPVPGGTSIPQSTAVAPNTPVRQEPAVAQGQPWMWLSAAPTIVGPGVRVTLELELESVGAGSLSGASLLLAEPAALHFAQVRITQGQVNADASGVTWEPGVLESGSGAFLYVDATVADDVLPEGAIPLQALLSWPAGQLASNPIALALPWAPLPETGE